MISQIVVPPQRPAVFGYAAVCHRPVVLGRRKAVQHIGIKSKVVAGEPVEAGIAQLFNRGYLVVRQHLKPFGRIAGIKPAAAVEAVVCIQDYCCQCKKDQDRLPESQILRLPEEKPDDKEECAVNKGDDPMIILGINKVKED